MQVKIIEFPGFDHKIIKVEFKQRIYWVISYYRKYERHLFEVIKEINKGKGTSILLSEQNLHQALKLADRAYVLETGRVVLAGTGEEVLNNDMVKKAYLGL